MRKLYTFLLLCLFTISVSAQDSQGKFPIYVLPEAMTDDGTTDLDMSLFTGMVETTKGLIAKYPKSYLVNDINQAQYVVGVFIDAYSRDTPKSGYDPKEGKSFTLYTSRVTYTLAISPIEHPEQIISKVGPYASSGTSSESFTDADQDFNKLEPRDGRIRELLEDALSLNGQITKVVPDAKHPEKAEHAFVNMGKNQGILSTQWFDVFVLDDSGNKGDKPIGTLHAVEVGDNETECSVKKGDKEILAAFNQGKTLVVETREEKNIWKSAGRTIDKIRVYIP